MERLERIKKETEFNHFNYPDTGKFALAFNLKQDDFDWLIEQAEKVESAKEPKSDVKEIVKMDKNRFEQLKRITQLEPKHATQLVFTMDDLKWLVSQCEKAEQLENEKLKGFVDLNIEN